MKLNNKIYDVLKIICLVVCPAFNVCITTLNLLWGWDLPIEATKELPVASGKITFDANHEMAGKELNFKIEFIELGEKVVE